MNLFATAVLSTRGHDYVAEFVLKMINIFIICSPRCEPEAVRVFRWTHFSVSVSLIYWEKVSAACHHRKRTCPRSVHPSGGVCNLPTIPSASDFNTVLSSDQNTLDGTHSQHSTSQDDIVDIEEGNQCPAAVQLADAQVTPTPGSVII